jgi:hypothetical protein
MVDGELHHLVPMAWNLVTRVMCGKYLYVLQEGRPGKRKRLHRLLAETFSA